MDISVIIVSFQVRDDLTACLQSIGAEMQTSGLAIEAIVVDNNSADGSQEMVRDRFPWAALLELNTNVGFAAACNIGADQAHGSYLLFLNPDAQIRPGACARLRSALEKDSTVGIAAPRLDNADGSLQVSCYPFPTLRGYVLAGTPLPWLRRFGRFGAHRFCNPARVDSRPVDWASGACLMIRADLFRDLAGFDERFFMYSEDVDLCWRVWQAGRRVLYVPSARVVHKQNRSEGAISAQVIERAARSLLLWFAKHRPGVSPYALAAAMRLGARLGGITVAMSSRLLPGLRQPMQRRVAWQEALGESLWEMRRLLTAADAAKLKDSWGLRLKACLKSRSRVARTLDWGFRRISASAIAVVETLASLRRLPSLEDVRSGIEDVLVVAFYGIGDTLMATPALDALHQALPQARIRAVCTRRTAPVLEQHPAVWQVEVIEEREFFTYARRLRVSKPPDLYVMIHSNLEYYLFGRLTGARYRAGFLWDYKAARAAGCRVRPVPNTSRSAVKRGLRVPELFGIESAERHPSMCLSEAERAVATAVLDEAGVEKGCLLVAVNVNKSTGLFGAGRWPEARWRAVIRLLRQEVGAWVVALGSLEEAGDVRRVLAPFCDDPGVVNVAGRLTLRESAALIEHCSLLVTADSGLMHLAGAVGTPAVAVFTFSDVESFASGARLIPVYRPVPCSPCVRNNLAAQDNYVPICRFSFRCGTAVTVGDVRQAIQAGLDPAQHSQGGTSCWCQ